MKLNNKGFAITAVLYGLLILFVVLTSSYLLVLSAKKDRVEKLAEEIESSYTGIQGSTNYKKLNDHIYNLYTAANKTTVTNNGITYNYATSVRLMNDRLGNEEVDINSGNIRYYGANPSNYIYFNCSDYSDTSTCETWRIIGIIDGKVKIIRKDSIGNLAWDQDKNQSESLTTYSNNWKTSSLQEFLNGIYYNRGDKTEYIYYSGSEGTTETTLDLESIGITSVTRNNNLISESTWYLGGYSSSELYPNDIYNYERQNKIGTTIYSTNDFKINANIGLMYASDYGYGTDLTKCSDDIYQYHSSTDSYACRANNWLFNSSNQWLITPHSLCSICVWEVHSAGRVSYTKYAYSTSSSVRPVLYLDPKLSIASDTDGSSTNPYRIIVN